MRVSNKRDSTHEHSVIPLNIYDETAPLRSVVLGIAENNGPAPSVESCYDPKSREHVLAGTYPKESDMIKEMNAVAAMLEKYGVTVYRPEIIADYNQIFSRDIGLVIDDIFIKSNILPDRMHELSALNYLIDQMPADKVITPPKEVHVEGGDVIVWHDHLFIGAYYGEDYPDYITARTNLAAIEFFKETFPRKNVVSFNLAKSNTDAKNNALHLDCCFQPVGIDKAVLFKGGFLIEEEYRYLRDFFGPDNVFELTRQEMYEMNSNFFSISPDVVISERNFTRLNAWLRAQGITVEEVPYAEIAKQEGLLRCSTLPLYRESKR